MRVTVLGASRLAVATIRQLIERGHEAVLIEASKDRIDELVPTLDCGIINGDGTLPHTLQEAYGDGANAFVALTNNDNVNIVAAAVARSIGFPRVVTQLNKPELLPIIDQLELGETITPHESAAFSLVEALEKHDQVSTVGLLSNQLRLVLVTVPASQEPTQFSELGLPAATLGIARIRQSDETGILADTLIEPHDRLLLLVSAEDHDDVVKQFTNG